MMRRLVLTIIFAVAVFAQPSERSVTYFYRADIAEMQEDYQTAVMLYKASVIADTEAVEPLKSLMELYRKIGDPISVLETGERIIKREPSDVAVRKEVVDLAEQMGFYDLARGHLIYLAKHNNNDPQVIARLFEYFMSDGDTASADSALLAISQAQMANPKTQKMIADIYINYNMLPKALPYMVKALDLSGDSLPDSYLGMALIMERMGNADTAIALYKHSFALSSPSEGAFLNYLALLARADKKDTAIAEAQKFIREREQQSSTMEKRLGLLFALANNPDSAAVHIAQSLDLEPDDTELMPLLADMLRKSGRPDSARSVYQRYLDTDPSLESRVGFAHFLMQMGDTVSAIERTEKLADEYPDSIGVLMFAGDMCLQATYYKDAIEYYSKASQLDSTDVFALFSLGDAYERSGDRKRSIPIFRKLIELKPDDPDIQNYLGYILADQDTDIVYAKELIASALEQIPTNAAYLDSYGWVLFRMGELDSALIYVNRAADSLKDPVIIDHIGEIYKAMGRLEDAQKAWQEAMKLCTKKQDRELLEKIKEKLTR